MEYTEGTSEGTQTGTGTGTEAPQAPAWVAQLPQELQGNTAITSHKTIGELGKSYLDSVDRLKGQETKVSEYEGKVKEFETKIASDYILKPKENATPEEKAAYLKAIGRPDTVEGYELPKIEIPAGMEKSIDPEGEKAFREDAYAIGLTKEQAGFLYKQFMGRNIGKFNQIQTVNEQTRQQATLALKTEWGNKFEENAEIANRTMAKFLTPELKTAFESAGLGNNPDLLKTFYQLGASMVVNDTLIRSDATANPHEAREPGKMSYPTMEA